MTESGALSGLRVLDLTDLKGHLCARLLADMGADVIKVEPPGGDLARSIGPFVNGVPHRDRSLFFWFYNLNKRSITLDIAHPEGVGILRRLASSADVVVESFRPGEFAEMGLGWDVLHAINPALILCSIAPFGQSGPYADWVADDSVLTALSGMLYVNGFADGAPVRPLGLQAYHSAAHYAAIAIMCALYAREETGIGQWIDLSMQEAAVSAVEHVSANYFGAKEIEPRRGSMHWTRFFRLGRCRDGYVVHGTPGDWTSLIEWVNSDGKAQDLTAPQWADSAKRYSDAEHLFDVLDEWSKDYACEELSERAQMLRLPYAVARAPEQLLNDEQLIARGYFAEVEHPELGRTFRYPGAPYAFNRSPWRVRRRPPLLGEHTSEILSGELGMTADDLAAIEGPAR